MWTANILDPIQKTLDPKVFNGTTPKPSVVSFIERLYDRAFKNEFDVPSHHYIEFYLTGSLTTYQYSPISDCDINVFPNYAELEQHTKLDDSVIRLKLIKMTIEDLDGTFLPGSSHPLQFFTIPDGIEPQDRFQPGLRSGWSFSAREWIVAPEKDRTHDIEDEFPEEYSRAAAIADKMTEMLDHKQHAAAKQLWIQVQRKRQLNQQHGGGDFSEDNIVYKYLVNEGMEDRLRNEVGMHITSTFPRGWDEDLIHNRYKELGSEDHFNSFPFIYDPTKNNLFLGEKDTQGHPALAYRYRQQGEFVPDQRQGGIWGRVFPDDSYGDYILAYENAHERLTPEQRQQILDAVWAKIPDEKTSAMYDTEWYLELQAQYGEQAQAIIHRFDSLWPDSVPTELEYDDPVPLDQTEHVVNNGYEWKFAYVRGKGAHVWGDGEVMSLTDGRHPHTYVLYDDLDAKEITPTTALGFISKPPLKEGDQPYLVLWRGSRPTEITDGEIQQALGLQSGEATIQHEGIEAVMGKVASGPIYYLGSYAYIYPNLYYGRLTHSEMIYYWEQEHGSRGGTPDDPYSIPRGAYGNIGVDDDGNHYFDQWTAAAGAGQDESLRPAAEVKLKGIFPGITYYVDQTGQMPLNFDKEIYNLGSEMKIAAMDNLTLKVYYNFDKDRVTLGTHADAANKPGEIIVGDYDPADKSVTLQKSENDWLNANYFRRLWAFSFPNRPLEHVYFQHGLTEDQKMHIPTREPQHVQHA